MNLSVGQNQGIAWSSDSNLWGNQLLNEFKFWTEPRYCMVLGLKPRGNQLLNKFKFWTELRYCMVLKLKPMGRSTT